MIYLLDVWNGFDIPTSLFAWPNWRDKIITFFLPSLERCQWYEFNQWVRKSMYCQLWCHLYADGIQLSVCFSECRQCSLPDVSVSGQNKDSDTKQMILSKDKAELMQADGGMGLEEMAEPRSLGAMLYSFSSWIHW